MEILGIPYLKFWVQKCFSPPPHILKYLHIQNVRFGGLDPSLNKKNKVLINSYIPYTHSLKSILYNILNNLCMKQVCDFISLFFFKLCSKMSAFWNTLYFGILGNGYSNLYKLEDASVIHQYYSYFRTLFWGNCMILGKGAAKHTHYAYEHIL